MLRAVLLSGLLAAAAHGEQALPFTLPLLDEELGEGPILLDF